MLHTLQNHHWQVGVLPKFGGGLHFGRMRYNGIWVDILRPPTTQPDNPNPASFLMLPWANRIGGGVLHVDDTTYQLQTTKDDGTARHGDVRKRAWQIVDSSETHIHLHVDSRQHENFNFPFALTADAIYRLDNEDLIWEVTLTNVDKQDFPAGFGFHPYFNRLGADMPQVQIPCDRYFPLENSLAIGAAQPIPPELDFRTMRPITDDMQFDNLLTEYDPEQPIRLHYTAWNTTIEMHSDPLFKHVILFNAPDGSIAIEPQTNANDGFKLHAEGVDGTGIFTVKAGESITSVVRLRIK